MKTWYAVTSQGRVVLSVWGAALRGHAEQAARDLEAKGFVGIVYELHGRKPRVLDHLTVEGSEVFVAGHR